MKKDIFNNFTTPIILKLPCRAFFNRKSKEPKQPEKAANITVRSFKAKKKDA